MGVNPITGKVYISDLFANTLTVLNASSRTILHSITLPGTADSRIAIDTKNNLVYVPVSGCTNLSNASNSCSSPAGQKLKGGVVRVDGRNDSITGEFGIDVQGLAINPATLMLYGVSTDYHLSNNPTGYILGIDGHSGAIASNISVSASPLDIAVDPKTNMVYASACGQVSLVCGNSEVLAINETSNRVQWTAPLGFVAINFPIVVNPATNSVFVMGETQNLVLDSIDEVTGKLIYSSALGSSCAGAGGGGLVLDAASNRIYAVSNSENFFVAVDAATGQLVSTMTTPQSGGEYNIALNPATREVFLTLEASPARRNTGYFVALSSATLDSLSHVDGTFLQRGVCLP